MTLTPRGTRRHFLRVAIGALVAPAIKAAPDFHHGIEIVDGPIMSDWVPVNNLARIGLRRLLLFIEKAVLEASEALLHTPEGKDRYRERHQTNNIEPDSELLGVWDKTQEETKAAITPLLNHLVASNAIRHFELVCDERNNPPLVPVHNEAGEITHVPRNSSRLTLYVYPNKSTEMIEMNFWLQSEPDSDLTTSATAHTLPTSQWTPSI